MDGVDLLGDDVSSPLKRPTNSILSVSESESSDANRVSTMSQELDVDANLETDI